MYLNVFALLIFILGWSAVFAALFRSKTLPLSLWLSEYVLELLVRRTNVSDHSNKKTGCILVAQPNTNSRPAIAGGSPIQSREELYAELWEFKERRKRKDSFIVRGSGAQNVAGFTEFFADVTEALTGQRTIPDQTYSKTGEVSLSC